MNFKLLIATKNKGKVREFKELLADMTIILHSANDFEALVEPEETGETFVKNALLKARYYAENTGMIAMADDSGLVVDALDGAPGVFSARYAGENATNKEKIEKLLSELKHIPFEKRSARFICAIAISNSQGDNLALAEGICEGKIAEKAIGSNGFGYDPIFIPNGYTQTFGEISEEIKHRISHRGVALAKIIDFLSEYTSSPLDFRF